jgi:hypothetical protein
MIKTKHIDTMMKELNTMHPTNCILGYVLDFVGMFPLLLHPTINFTIENEADKKLNMLDLIIHREHNKLNFTIYRKPTSTDILIHNSSCHPNEHELGSINYLINLLHTYPLLKDAKEAELDIRTILQNNQYKLTHILTKDTDTKNLREKKHDNKKWATCAYVWREMKSITKLFKDVNINIAYKTHNTTE